MAEKSVFRPEPDDIGLIQVGTPEPRFAGLAQPVLEKGLQTAGKVITVYDGTKDIVGRAADTLLEAGKSASLTGIRFGIDGLRRGINGLRIAGELPEKINAGLSASRKLTKELREARWQQDVYGPKAAVTVDDVLRRHGYNPAKS